MGNRKPLDPQTALTFQGRTFYTESLADRGSNALVYRGRQEIPDGSHPVLIRELFPYHPEGKIFRDPQGQIRASEDAQELLREHRQCFQSVSQAHTRFLADHPEYPSDGFFCFQQNETLYCIYDYANGRTLESVLREADADLRAHTLRVLKLLDALEAFHKTGILHLDITPDSIHVCGSRQQYFLLDHSCLHAIGRTDISYLRFRPGYRAPELETMDPRNAVFASDLYSVAAVFFRCLMGRALSLEELLLPKAPDGQDSPCLASEPASVRTMVSKILKKGLHELPEKRYRSIGQMRQAFQELLSRIDHAGVTSCALWEAGRRKAEMLVRKDPALRRSISTASPFSLRLPEQPAAQLRISDGKDSRLFLLQQVLTPEKRYRADLSPAFYLTLRDAAVTDPHMIRSQILGQLGISPDANGIAALEQLLQQPTDAPVLVFLDDRSGQIPDTLLQEIRLLSAMPGIRILIASPREDLPLPRVDL